MKKFSLVALLAATAITFSSAAYAADQGGYMGPAAEMITVEQVQGLNDEAMVIMKGTLTQSLGDEMYVFSDSTGTINVEIEDDDWNGMKAGQNDMVIIKGEVDKNDNMVYIEVDEIAIANP